MGKWEWGWVQMARETSRVSLALLSSIISVAEGVTRLQ